MDIEGGARNVEAEMVKGQGEGGVENPDWPDGVARGERRGTVKG